MPDTGFIFPQTGENVTDSGSINWGGPTNIQASPSAANATHTNKGQLSRILVARNFDFSGIPGGSTILGIEVQIRRKADAGTTAFDDSVIQLRQSGSYIGSNYSSADDWGITYEEEEYGGAADLWGTSLTLADIQSSDFGVGLQVESGIADNRVASVQWIKMKVTYEVYDRSKNMFMVF